MISNSTEGPLYTLVPSYVLVDEDETGEGRVFENYVEFPNLVVAQNMLTYW